MTQDETPTHDDDTPGDAQGPEQDETKHISSNARSLAEWTTLAISILIVLVFVGLITWLQVSGNGKPAIVSVEPNLENLRHDDTGYYLPVTIRNDGEETIEQVVIQANLTSSEGETETRELTIDFLVRDEVTSGTFIFTQDPTAGDLTINAASYMVP